MAGRPGSKRSERLVGRPDPRLGTEPARRLTRATTKGYELCDFAEHVLGEPLLPWQRTLALRGLEVDRGGGARFRTVVATCGRQSGKTSFARALALWKLYMDGGRLVVGAAQDLSVARETWRAGVAMVQSVPDLAAEVARVSRTNGDEHLELSGNRRWKITAANRSAGRGLSADLVLMDEAREQRSWDAWSALSKTTFARADGQVWVISTAGDAGSVVLRHLRDAGLAGTDPSICVLEWSAPDGAELDDRQAWAQACPGIGHTVSEAAVRSAMGTDPPEVFRCEVLNLWVDALGDVAVPADAWAACTDHAMSLDGLRDRVALCVDVSPDLQHATLAAAAVGTDGRVRVEVVAAWSGPDATAQMRADLPGWVERVRPRVKAWMPSGPTAALAPDLDAAKWTRIQAGDVSAACQAFAEQVTARRLLHADDGLLSGHVLGAKRWAQGDGWRLVRRGVGHVDAAYAAAGAVHLARTLPVKPRAFVIAAR
jgi:hypothetical protein